MIKVFRSSPLEFKADLDRFLKAKGETIQVTKIETKPVRYEYFVHFEEVKQEIWRDVKGWDGLYRASNLGRIFSVRYSRIIVCCRNEETKMMVTTFSQGKKKKRVTVHRVIAETWIPNPKKLPDVRPKNGSLFDTHPENLYWSKRL